MTLWFPIRLMQTIRASLPRVDPYTELGQKRTRPEMELEYQRLLERDRNPFAFLYKGKTSLLQDQKARLIDGNSRLPPFLGNLQIHLSLGETLRPTHCSHPVPR